MAAVGGAVHVDDRSWGLHAAKADVVRGGPDFAFAAGADHVTGAILVRAQVRAAALDALLLPRLRGIERALRALRVARDDPGARESLVVVGVVPVAHPFPGVAGDVIQPVARRRERSDSGESRVPILAGIRHRKASLVRVGHRLPTRMEVVAPGVELSGQPAARREFPLGLRGEPLAGPVRVRRGIFVSDLYDGMLVASFQAATGALRMTPIRGLL